LFNLSSKFSFFIEGVSGVTKVKPSKPIPIAFEIFLQSCMSCGLSYLECASSELFNIFKIFSFRVKLDGRTIAPGYYSND
jgi:hypothetical protein